MAMAYAISDNLISLSQVFYFKERSDVIEIGNPFKFGYIQDGLNTIDFSSSQLPESDI